MRRLSTLLFLAVMAPPVRADLPTRLIGWEDAVPGHMNVSPDCDALPDFSTLVLGLEAAPECPQVARILIELDFCTLPNALPDWWHVEPGGCRGGGMEVSVDFGGGPGTLADPWPDPASVAVTVEHHPGWQGNPVLMHTRITLEPSTPITLPEGAFYVCRVVFDNRIEGCAGCELAACFVVNNLVLYRPGGDYCETGMDYYAGYGRWQTGQPDCPFIVSAVPETWGGIKARHP